MIFSRLNSKTPSTQRHLPELDRLVGSRLFLAPAEEEAEEAEEALLAWGTLVERGLAKSTSSSDLWLGATTEK